MFLRRFPLLAAFALTACAMPTTPQTTPIQQGQSSSTITINAAPDQADIAAGDVPVDANTSQSAIPERMLPGGMLEIGKADAPVSLLIFTNHSCAYCTQFHRDQFPRLIAEYVSEGNVRITLVPFQLKKYPQSAEQAALSLCSAKAGKGRITQDQLFEGKSVQEIADVTMAPCVNDALTQSDLMVQRAWAQTLGVSLIPTFIVNGQQITGLPEYADLAGTLDAALRNTENR